MVGGSGDLDAVVSEFEREFSAAEEGLILPAPDVGVSTNTREPLGNLEDFSALFEFLHVTPPPSGARVGEGVVPIDEVGEALAGFEGLREVNAHHGVDNTVLEFSATCIGELIDLETAIESFFEKERFEGIILRLAEFWSLAALMAQGARSVFVPVELHPNILQGMRRLVVVDDAALTCEKVFTFFKGDLEIVIGPLLPVFRARGSGSDTGFRRSGPDFFKLAKGVIVILNRVSKEGGNESKKDGGDLHKSRG